MKPRKGIVLAGGSGTRLHPITLATSKQLLPVYDKPLIYYPLSTLMLAGLREIAIITTPHDAPAFKKLLGDGSAFGIEITWLEQPKPEGLAQAFLIAESFLDGAPSALVLGDNLFHGNTLGRDLKYVDEREEPTVFAVSVSNPSDYGVVSFDETGRATTIEEKPENPRSNFAVPGLYFYGPDASEVTRTLKPSARGELEITALNNVYLQQGRLHVQPLTRGCAWFDTGSPEALQEASRFVEIVEKRQGLKIGCPEEIAWNKGWIDATQLRAQAEALHKTAYGRYLFELTR